MNYSLDSTYLAAKECIAHGIPFALCFKPGVSIDQTPEFYVENPNVGLGYKELNSLDFESFNGFVVSPFDINTHQRIFGIKDEISSKEILRYFAETPAYRKYNNFHFKYNSTTECDHKHAVEQVSRSFKSDSEKTVLSRILVNKFAEHPVDVAYKYFHKHPSCFRYILSLPNYGIWFGATPELLLEYNRNDYELATMSLAGTRTVSDLGAWDRKNTLEHNIVTKYICNILSNHGLSVDEPRESGVKFNNIEHLCHLIKAHGFVQVVSLLADLSPTPAVCGWPKEEAFNQIINAEKHSRLLYGGYVGTTSSDYTHLFVNLRCAFADLQDDNSAIYTLFAGGGITSHSDPDIEWKETELKLESLYYILRNL